MSACTHRTRSVTPGFIVSALAYGAVYGRNFIRWQEATPDRYIRMPTTFGLASHFRGSKHSGYEDIS